MDEQEGRERPAVPAVKSRPGTFGLTSKLNSLAKDDSIRKDDDDDEQKKNSGSKSTLEKLLEEEERKQVTMARESTGAVIYDYDEPVTIPYAVQIQENASVESVATESNTLQQEVKEEEFYVTEDTTAGIGDTTIAVPDEFSDESNQLSYTSESYTLEVSNDGDDDLATLGIQPNAAMGLTDDDKLFSNTKLSDTKNSLELLQKSSLANSPASEDANDIEDEENAEEEDDTPKKRVSSFLRRLFTGSKKKTSE